MGEMPFHDVNYHSMILAPDGRRMSKSLGTGIDPTNLIDEYGADATRYGLLKMASTQDVRFSPGAIEEGAKLANKLWNVARLILANVGRGAARGQAARHRGALDPRAARRSARAELEAAIAEFEFSPATSTLYHLTFDDFCDWYAEAIKPRLYERRRGRAGDGARRARAAPEAAAPGDAARDRGDLVAPPARETRLIVSPWPEPDERFADDLDALDRVQEAASDLPRAAACGSTSTRTSSGSSTRSRVPDRVQADGDAQAESDRLEKEIARAEGMLANERFTSKAPPEVVEAEREKLERYRRELDALRD